MDIFENMNTPWKQLQQALSSLSRCVSFPEVCVAVHIWSSRPRAVKEAQPMSPRGQTQLRGLCPVCSAKVRVLLPTGGRAGHSWALPGHSSHTVSVFSSGGYDENDVTFTWLRGNNSVHGMERLRLSQYTVERYHTLVSKSQQETGKSEKAKSRESSWAFPIPSPFLLWARIVWLSPEPVKPLADLNLTRSTERWCHPISCSQDIL